MRLIFVRHGETLWNREFRLQGTSDVPLSPLGTCQAAALAQAFRFAPQKIFVSPLQRTRAFAAPLAARFGLEPAILDDLREMSFGLWEGLRYQDMDSKMQHHFENWCLNPVKHDPPEGEGLAALAVRVSRAVAAITATLGQEDTAVAVTHGGIIRAATATLISMPLIAIARIQIDPASVTVLDYVGGVWKLVHLNDTCHLACHQES